MKHKKTWGTFFAATSAIAIGGMSATAIIARKACGGIFHQTEDLVNTFIKNGLSISGSLQMDVTVGDGDMTLPVMAKNLIIDTYLNRNKQFIELLQKSPEIAEGMCQKDMWETGINATLLLLLASAAVCGVTYVYKASQKPDIAVSQESLVDEEAGYISSLQR